MTTAIITAISTLVGAIISGIVALIVSGMQNSKTITLLNYRLGELEKKVEKHNNIIERITVLEENEKAQWKRIDELKEKANV